MSKMFGFSDQRIIGEYWALSGHKSYHNQFKVGGELVTFDDLPFLVKLINSGSWLGFKEELRELGLTEILHLNYHDLHVALSELALKNKQIKSIHDKMLTKNLSIQIHPIQEMCGKNSVNNWEHKLESWYVLEAEEGAGIYLGFKDGVGKDFVKESLEKNNDISDLLNFVPVESGDVFFIPTGTAHAIGAGVFLVEVQEPADTTFRYYDWGRVDETGVPRKLHIEEALKTTNWQALPGKRKILDITSYKQNISKHQNLINESEFSYDYVELEAGEIFEDSSINGVQGVVVLEGSVTSNVPSPLEGEGQGEGEAKALTSFLIPKQEPPYTLKAKEKTRLLIIRTDFRTFSLRNRVSNPVKLSDIMNQSHVPMGTSGARGLVRDMTDEVCYALTTAFLQFLKIKKQPVAYAGDHRDYYNSTNRMMNAVEKAILDFGCEPVNLGKVPTPTLAYWGSQTGMPGIMITGSHIPEDRNGIKFYLAGGKELLKEHEPDFKNQQINMPWEIFGYDGQIAIPSPLPVLSLSNGAGEGKGEGYFCYITRYTSFFSNDTLKELSIGLYKHSSVGRDMLHQILKELGANVGPEQENFGRATKFLPVDTEDIRKEDINLAKRWCVDYKFDAVVSGDGDFDRPLVFTEKGEPICGDRLGVLTCLELKRMTGQEMIVVTPITCSHALEETGEFKKVVRTKIGSPYVVSAMYKELEDVDSNTIVVGYERNGGFFLGSTIQSNNKTLTPLVTRDAVLPIILVLKTLKESKEPLSKIHSSLPPIFTTSESTVMKHKESLKLIDMWLKGNVKHDEPGVSVTHITQIDGVRVSFSNGDVWHIRASGNEPKLRVYREFGRFIY